LTGAAGESPAVVLVHGAWHGGWCWQAVAERLRAAGLRSYAPSLTGLADRRHLLGARPDLDTHIDDIVNLIEWERLEHPVLCGHSYGGMVITGVAERIGKRLGGIVYLDAFLPAAATSCADLARSGPFPDETVPPPDPAYLGLSGELAEYAVRWMTPHPTATLRQVLTVTGAVQDVAEKLYVIAGRPHRMAALSEAYERCRSDAAWRVAEIVGGHELMLEFPDAVASLLIAMAGRIVQAPVTRDF
jgi:pimeloyl-ACP methyl ester carboxylesterase